MSNSRDMENTSKIAEHQNSHSVVDVTRKQSDEKKRGAEKVDSGRKTKEVQGVVGDALDNYHREVTANVRAEGTHQGTLNDIKASLEKFTKLVNDHDMGNEFRDNSGLQSMLRDTEKDSKRISVMTDDLIKRPEERAEDRKVWTNKVQADKSISNDTSSQASSRIGWIVGSFSPIPGTEYHAKKYIARLNNRMKHREGDKLYKKSGSAELTTSVKEQEFRERDWDVSRLRDWHREIESRTTYLKYLRQFKENHPNEKIEIQYQSRYLEHMQRLPQPKDQHPEIEIQAKEAIRDVNQQLRVTTDEKDIQKLLARLPDRELQKQLHLLGKEAGYRMNGRKENRTTLFEPEHMDDAQLKRLFDGAKEQTHVREVASDLFKILKDRSKAEISSKTQQVKDFVRQPKEDFASVHGRIAENHYNAVSQELSLRMQEDSMMSEKSMWQALTKENSRLTSEIVNGLSPESVKGFLNDPKETTYFELLAQQRPDYADLVADGPAGFNATES